MLNFRNLPSSRPDRLFLLDIAVLVLWALLPGLLVALYFAWKAYSTWKASEWRPIATAPKGHEALLLYGAQESHGAIYNPEPQVFVGYWDSLDKAWCATGSTWEGPFYLPTHWRPLPKK